MVVRAQLVVGQGGKAREEDRAAPVEVVLKHLGGPCVPRAGAGPPAEVHQTGARPEVHRDVHAVHPEAQGNVGGLVLDGHMACAEGRQEGIGGLPGLAGLRGAGLGHQQAACAHPGEQGGHLVRGQAHAPAGQQQQVRGGRQAGRPGQGRQGGGGLAQALQQALGGQEVVHPRLALVAALDLHLLPDEKAGQAPGQQPRKEDQEAEEQAPGLHAAPPRPGARKWTAQASQSPASAASGCAPP